MVKIRGILDDKNNTRRYEDSLNFFKDKKLIPWKEEENEKYVFFYNFSDFFIIPFLDGFLHNASSQEIRQSLSRSSYFIYFYQRN